ncbi:hypothetical protein IHV84_02605 [Acidovorax sp. IB03]|uniref:hypothetical protein n=1 Tax=Acidovorax sp. IB03 TaxID=2779366 RepID=UPI0018E6EB1C|nr:hypothetical protein [Acidovorax sp. IB03]MBJ2162864.1 hypothetical protein [Acidovorax sp. IB03]
MTKPAKLKFTIYQGATFRKRLRWSVKATGVPIDLTGCTARMQVRAEAGATINVSSNAMVRVGLRDFTLDVSVVTMLREISARTEPLSVVAMTAQRQVNATTKKQEVAVTA